jgi:hypothetical protein
VALFRERIARARSERDWIEFKRVLVELQDVSSERRIQSLLVELLRDESLRFQGEVGRLFHRLLIEAEVPGIGAATWIRLRSDLERRFHADARSWISLIARHGDQAEVDALAGLIEEGPEFLRLLIARELTRVADRPEIVPHLELLYSQEETAEWYVLYLGLPDVARANPALGYRIARERFDRVHGLGIKTIATALRIAATPAQLDEVNALVVGIEDDWTLVHALDGILRQGDLDAGGLEPAIERVMRMLEDPARFEAVDDLVHFHRLFWTPRTLAALEARRADVKPEKYREHRTRIEILRKYLGLTKDTWKPDR